MKKTEYLRKYRKSGFSAEIGVFSDKIKIPGFSPENQVF